MQQLQFPPQAAPPVQDNSEPSLEELRKQLATHNIQMSMQNMQFQQNMSATMKNLQTQAGQIASTINNLQQRSSGTLPYQPVWDQMVNVNAITVSSGTELDDMSAPVLTYTTAIPPHVIEEEEEEEEVFRRTKVDIQTSSKASSEVFRLTKEDISSEENSSEVNSSEENSSEVNLSEENPSEINPAEIIQSEALSEIQEDTLSMEVGDQIMHSNISDSLNDSSPSSTAAHCIDVITPHVSSIDCISPSQAMDSTSSLNKLECINFENKPFPSNLIKEVVANNNDVDSMLEALKDIHFEHETEDNSAADVVNVYIDFVSSNLDAAAASVKSECFGLITEITYAPDFVEKQTMELHNSGRFCQSLELFPYLMQPLMFDADKQVFVKIIEEEPPPPEPPPPSFYLIFILTNLVHYFTNPCFEAYVADIEFPSSAKNPPDPH